MRERASGRLGELKEIFLSVYPTSATTREQIGGQSDGSGGVDGGVLLLWMVLGLARAENVDLERVPLRALMPALHTLEHHHLQQQQQLAQQDSTMNLSATASTTSKTVAPLVAARRAAAAAAAAAVSAEAAQQLENRRRRGMIFVPPPHYFPVAPLPGLWMRALDAVPVQRQRRFGSAGAVAGGSRKVKRKKRTKKKKRQPKKSASLLGHLEGANEVTASSGVQVEATETESDAPAAYLAHEAHGMQMMDALQMTETANTNTNDDDGVDGDRDDANKENATDDISLSSWQPQHAGKVLSAAASLVLSAAAEGTERRRRRRRGGSSGKVAEWRAESGGNAHEHAAWLVGGATPKTLLFWKLSVHVSIEGPLVAALTAAAGYDAAAFAAGVAAAAAGENGATTTTPPLVVLARLFGRQFVLDMPLQSLTGTDRPATTEWPTPAPAALPASRMPLWGDTAALMGGENEPSQWSDRASYYAGGSGIDRLQLRGWLPLYGNLREIRRLLAGDGGAPGSRAIPRSANARKAQGSMQLALVADDAAAAAGITAASEQQWREDAGHPAARTVAVGQLHMAPVGRDGALVAQNVPLRSAGTTGATATINKKFKGPKVQGVLMTCSAWLDPMHRDPKGWSPTVPVASESSLCGVLTRR